MEGYYQETGRAGRDGLPANAWMVYGFGDVVNLRKMVDAGEASEDRKRVERQKLSRAVPFVSTVCIVQTAIPVPVESPSRSAAVAAAARLPPNRRKYARVQSKGMEKFC
jgi:superfamily II DNA helicase RecQ